MSWKEIRDHALSLASKGVQINDGHIYNVHAADIVDYNETIRALVEELDNLIAATRPDMESLLDTREGLALAKTAYSEGASHMLRSCNEHTSGPWSPPENPYSAPLLGMIRGGE